MAQNHVQPGHVMPWTNGTLAAVASGDLVEVGALVGVALGDIAVDAAGQLALNEVWEAPKAAEAIDQGAALYYDPVNAVLTIAVDDGGAPATAYTYAGKAFAAAAALDENVQVRLG